MLNVLMFIKKVTYIVVVSNNSANFAKYLLKICVIILPINCLNFYE